MGQARADIVGPRVVEIPRGETAYHTSCLPLYEVLRQSRFAEIGQDALQRLLLEDHSGNPTYRNLGGLETASQKRNQPPTLHEAWEDPLGRTVQRRLYCIEHAGGKGVTQIANRVQLSTNDGVQGHETLVVEDGVARHIRAIPFADFEGQPTSPFKTQTAAYVDRIIRYHGPLRPSDLIVRTLAINPRQASRFDESEVTVEWTQRGNYERSPYYQLTEPERLQLISRAAGLFAAEMWADYIFYNDGAYSSLHWESGFRDRIRTLMGLSTRGSEFDKRSADSIITQHDQRIGQLLSSIHSFIEARKRGGYVSQFLADLDGIIGRFGIDPHSFEVFRNVAEENWPESDIASYAFMETAMVNYLINQNHGRRGEAKVEEVTRATNKYRQYIMGIFTPEEYKGIKNSQMVGSGQTRRIALLRELERAGAIPIHDSTLTGDFWFIDRE